MANEVKILFTADIHLGIDPDVAIIDEKTHFNTFKKIISLACEHDLLLIGGDLFNNSNIPDTLIKKTAAEFEKLASKGVDVIFTPGPGDINKNGVVPDHLYALNCTTVFANPVYSPPHVYGKNKQKVYIYGLPYSGGRDISKIKKESEDGFHIGLFHMDFNPRHDQQDSPVFTLQKDDIKSLDLDFYALGHSHTFRMFRVNNKIIGAFPGTPEALDTSETGDRYIISITVDQNEIQQIKRLSVNSIHVIKHIINCNEHDDPEIIFDIFRESKSKKNYLHLSLEGDRSFAFDQSNLDNHTKEFYNLQINDNSMVTLESLIKEHKNENTLRGIFFKKLEEKISANTFSQDEILMLNQSIDTIRKNGFTSLEDWLCTISQ